MPDSPAADAFFLQLRESLKAAGSKGHLAPRPGLRPAAVLAPLMWRDDEPWVILTQRPLTLRQHAGQISFPGGGSEASDVTPLHTALRESHEELGIVPHTVDVLGMLSPISTITSFWVMPFVAKIPDDVKFEVSQAEIAEVLEAPLWRLRPVQTLIYGAKREALVWDDGRHTVWGATFTMLRELHAVAATIRQRV
jgi:8-oxo-dGTP pyrophosphatase MutT (NUDIX family)